MQPRRLTALASLLPALLLAAAGCGGSGEDTARPPEVLAFSANPATLSAGETTVLSWKTRNAQAIAIVEGDGNELDVAGRAVGAGSIQVVLDETGTFTFTFTATGAEGTSPAQETLTVTVNALPEPRVVSFVADRTVLAAGESATLSWETENAETIWIADQDGHLVDLGGEAVGAGSVEVSPEGTSTYTLTASGLGGEDTASVELVLQPEPVITVFTATPNEPLAPTDTAVTLTWATEHADAVSIVDPLGNELDTGGATSGTVQVAPTLSTTYTVLATGPGGEAEAHATVHVLALVESFQVSPQRVRPGETVTLSWRTAGASALSIGGPSGYTFEAPAGALAAGSTTSVATQSGEYVLVASSTANKMPAEALLEVTDGPVLRTFAVSKEAFSAGESATITWTAVGADSVALTVDGELVDVEGIDPAGGSIDVLLGAPGRVRLELTVANANGVDAQQKDVEVLPAAGVTAFSALPVRTHTGGDVTLSWATTDAAGVKLTRNGVDLGIDTGLLAGSLTETVFEEVTYVLQAFNPLGYVTTSQPLTITVGGPVVVDYSLTPDVVAPGEALAFSWAVHGGTSLGITDATATVVHGTTEVAEIASGSTSLAAPLDLGEYAYMLTVTDPDGGTASAERNVKVTDGPIIRTFQSLLSAATENDTTTLSWIVSNDLQGNVPTLSLLVTGPDGEERSLDISDRDANASQADFTLASPGTWSFALSATTPSGESHSRSVSVTVLPTPDLVSFDAAPRALSTEGGSVQPSTELSWETANGHRLVLDQMTANGYVTVYESTDGESVAAGTLVVHPSQTTLYRLRVENALQAFDFAQLQVTVDAPVVTRFDIVDPVTGDPVTDVTMGAPIKVIWETAQADVVSITPLAPPFTEVTGGWIDISETGQELPLTNRGRDGTAVLTFPDGFFFPWEGNLYSQVLVTNAGYIAFDINEAPYTTNQPVPDPDRPQSGALMPFWDLNGAGQDGALLWERRTDPVAGEFVIVQWSHFDYDTTIQNDYNFQVWLWADGNVEFHYDAMLNITPTTYWYVPLGRWATIGLEFAGGRVGTQVSYNADVEGGLEGKGYAFDLHTAPAGEREFVLTAANAPDEYPYYTFAISAGNDNGFATARKPLVVHESALLAGVAFEPLQPQVGEPFEMLWTQAFAGTAKVKDAQGTVLCEFTSDPKDPTSIQRKCEIVPTEPGVHPYTVELVGYLASNVVTETVDVPIYPPFALNSFTVNGLDMDFASSGEAVMLEWDTVGVTTLEFYANGVLVETIQDPPAQGSVAMSPEVSATYTLRVSDTSDFSGRSAERTVFVYVGAAQVESFVPSTTQIPWGGESPVQISWDTSDADSVRIRSTVGSYGGMYTGGSFESLVGDPLASNETPDGTMDDQFVEIDTKLEGFKYPFDGGLFDTFTISANGFVAVGHPLTAGSPYSVNNKLPSTTYKGFVAGFWEDLEANASGEPHLLYRVVGEAPNRALVVEWNDVKPSNARGSLTFQVALHEDGKAEVRFLENAPYPREVDLSWTAPGATSARLEDSHGNVLVDTDSGTSCGSAPCNPAGDTIRVSNVTEVTDWRLRAWNASGEDVAMTFIDYYSIPELDFTISPAVLPATGPVDVTLSWNVNTSNEHTWIVDDQGNLIVDTDSKMLCPIAGKACNADKDSFVVSVDRPTTWTLIVKDDSDEFYRTRDVHIGPEGSPIATLSADIVLLEGDSSATYWQGMAGTATNYDWDYFHGYSATLGWSASDGAYGESVFHSTTSPSKVAPGVSHVFNAGAAASGSLDWYPGETATITICAEGGNYVDCDQLEVLVVQPGNVMITELMVDPAGVTPELGQWVEIRSAFDRPLDVAGWTLDHAQGTYRISSDAPLILKPAEYLVLARSADPAVNGGLEPDLAYGLDAPGLVMSSKDEVRLSYGGFEIDGVAWDETWPAADGASWHLDGYWILRGEEANDVPVFNPLAEAVPVWCAADAAYGTGGSLGNPGATGRTCSAQPYSIDPGGAVFMDIRQTGTRLPDAEAAKSATEKVPDGLGFVMPFFDGTVTELHVNHQGFVTFAPLAAASYTLNRDIPDARDPNLMVAGFWESIEVRDDGTSWLGYEKRTVDGRKVTIVQWDAFQYSSYDGWATFQIQLWENGDIHVVFDRMQVDPTVTASTAPNYYRGRYATVGLENSDGTAGVRFSYNEQLLYPGLGLRFLRVQP